MTTKIKHPARAEKPTDPGAVTTHFEFEAFPIYATTPTPTAPSGIGFGLWSTLSFHTLKQAKSERRRIAKAREKAGRKPNEMPIFRVVRERIA